MDVILKEKGQCRYALIPEKTAFFNWLPVNASYVDRLFGTEKAPGLMDAERLVAPEGKPLLLGQTGQEPSRQALQLIEKDQWIITEIDDALVVTGWFDAATVEAAHQ